MPPTEAQNVLRADGETRNCGSERRTLDTPLKDSFPSEEPPVARHASILRFSSTSHWAPSYAWYLGSRSGSGARTCLSPLRRASCVSSPPGLPVAGSPAADGVCISKSRCLAFVEFVTCWRWRALSCIVCPPAGVHRGAGREWTLGSEDLSSRLSLTRIDV